MKTIGEIFEKDIAAWRALGHINSEAISRDVKLQWWNTLNEDQRELIRPAIKGQKNAPMEK